MLRPCPQHIAHKVFVFKHSESFSQSIFLVVWIFGGRQGSGHWIFKKCCIHNLKELINSAIHDLGFEEINLSQNELISLVLVGSNKLYEKLTRMDLSRNRLEGISAEMRFYGHLRYLNPSWSSFKAKIYKSSLGHTLTQVLNSGTNFSITVSLLHS